MTEAQWLAIPEAPSYSISNRGEVKDSSGKLLPLDGGRVNLFGGGQRIRMNVRRKMRELFPDFARDELNEDGEVWKPIPGHSDYELSNHARVRRGARMVAHGQFGATRVMAPKILKTSRNNGYLVVYLGVPGSRKGAIFYVEKWLFELFPELIPEPITLPNEEWRDVAGYEGLYQVSNLGRIASIGRLIDDGRGRNRYIRGRIREPGCTGNGYPKIEFAKNGETVTALLHRVVAESFVPNPDGLPFVHHKDEDKLNARADNLEWISKGGNVRDWFDHRPHRVDEDFIKLIMEGQSAGQDAATILAGLPKKRKPRGE